MRRWQEEGIDPHFYTHRRRTLDEIFPWEHIDIAVTKKFLSKDYLMSLEQETRIDCRHQCFACGILPELKDLRRETPPEAWQCPPVKKRASWQKQSSRNLLSSIVFRVTIVNLSMG